MLKFTVEGAKFVKQVSASANYRTYEFDVYVQGAVGMSAATVKITADAPGPSDPGMGVLGADGKPLTKPVYPHRLSIYGATDTTQYVHSTPVDGDGSLSTTATVDVYNDMWVTVAWFRYNTDPSGAVEAQLNFNVKSNASSSPVSSSPTPVPSPTGKTPSPYLTPTPTPEEIFTNELKIISIEGNASFQVSGSNSGWWPATNYLTLQPGDKLRVQDGTVITEFNGGQMCLLSGSEIEIISPESSYATEPRFGVDLDSGSCYIKSSSGSVGITVQTPHGIITDLGTEYEIVVDDSSTVVRTYSGYVQVSDLTGKNMVFLGSGDTTKIVAGGKPLEPVSFDLNSVDNWWNSIELSPSPSVPELPFNIIIGLISLLTLVVVCFRYSSKLTLNKQQQCILRFGKQVH